MEQRPASKASGRSSIQEITRLFWKPDVHYRVHNRTLFDPILSQMNPGHNFSSYFPNIRSNIIFPSTPMSFELSLTFNFANKNFICILISTYVLHGPPISLSLIL
jgi:hypothetical protein